MKKVTDLLEQIEKLRNKLRSEVDNKGLSHHSVIKISQTLDKKIVQFYLRK